MQDIVICGSGLAAKITVAALARQLPKSIRITFVQIGHAPAEDLFYGSVTGPTAYAFNLAAGVKEPRLVLDSNTAFSWGTKYDHWADGARSWIQCFQLPLPIIDGVMFHQYVAQQGMGQLEPFLVGAVAARKGAFVHPPQQPGDLGKTLLAQVEYGYQFDPLSYGALFNASVDKERLRVVASSSCELERKDAAIEAIRLADGVRIAGDLFVDCTGPKALLLGEFASEFTGSRRLGAAGSHSLAQQLGAPIRTVSQASFGWRSETPLRGRRARLTVFHPDSADQALREHPDGPELSCEATLGRRKHAWSGNCVGVGQAAAVVEPLTIAPMLLLQRDIERLISLIPLSADMAVERCEYNRRAAEDHEHAGLFTQALFQTSRLPDAPYWQEACAEPVDEKLARKIEMFSDRGLLVAYDLEPFHPEDWTILHFGMGRRPARHDLTADRAPAERVRAFLSNMKQDVEKLAVTLPSHATYMEKLSSYLMQDTSRR